MRFTEKTIREKSCEREHLILSPLAAFADSTKGRLESEDECPIRTPYQRDRDRIIHSSSFRRLKHKTQVFLSPEGDYYRTRLTHTLEVAQIARTIASAMCLNEDLTEAIALGHDLGHTPFGHAGERALNEVNENGFAHYKQSLRVVDRLEKSGKGLNLTWEVRNGIVCHTCGEQAATLEGRIVRIADKIAYINHDIDDATIAGVMCEYDIPRALRDKLGHSKSERINTMVLDTINNSSTDIEMSDSISEAFEELHSFMFKKVYTNPVCKSEESKAVTMLQRLYLYFADNSEALPESYRRIAAEDGVNAAACDYIAGMTDTFAVKCYKDIFIPKAWIE